VILYSSDHGSFYGEHGFGGKWLMHEESIRTPMILRDPRLSADCRGTQRHEMVLNIDIPATLLDLAGIDKPAGMQGKSFLPLASAEAIPWRTEWFYENHYCNSKADPIAASEGIRTRDWKYIRYVDEDPVYEQLYDLNADPREETNLAVDVRHQHILADLRQRWNRWKTCLDRFALQYTPDQPWHDPV
jgi:arylsulfatase A-like enzyme